MRKRIQKLQLRFMRYKRLRWPRHVRKMKVMSRHPYAVLVATFAVLLVVSAVVFSIVNRVDHPVSNAYIVIVTHDGVHQTVPSQEPTVGALLTKLHIKLNQGDVVEPAQPAHINSNDFRINIYRAVPVEIVEGTSDTFTFSAATTPRAIAQQTGVVLYPEDELTTAPSTNFTAGGAVGKVVTIKPSVPISLILYGTPTETRSHSDTVGEMLAEKGIVLRNGDTVQPAAATPITPNAQIFILHKGTEIVTATQSIPEPVQTVDDPTLSSGTKAIRQQGSPGSLLITYQVDVKTGAKTQLQSVQIAPPVPEIEAIGTAPVTGNLGTWQRLGLSGLPSSAPPSVQDQAIVSNTNRSGGGLASQNPGCYERTGISAFPPS